MNNIDLGQQIDAISRLLHPHLLYPENSRALTDYITSISLARVILLKPRVLQQPAVIAGLSPGQAQHVFLNDILDKKQALIAFFTKPDLVEKARLLARQSRHEKQFNHLKAYIDDKLKYFN